jgi:hypothetical protein
MPHISGVSSRQEDAEITVGKGHHRRSDPLSSENQLVSSLAGGHQKKRMFCLLKVGIP